MRQDRRRGAGQRCAAAAHPHRRAPADRFALAEAGLWRHPIAPRRGGVYAVCGDGPGEARSGGDWLERFHGGSSARPGVTSTFVEAGGADKPADESPEPEASHLYCEPTGPIQTLGLQSVADSE